MKNNISNKELDEFLGPTKADGLLALKELNLLEKTTILDVGTGAGISAIFFALHDFLVITGEPESDNSVYAKMDWEANAEKFGVRDSIKFRAFDATRMPFEENSFDAIVFFGSLHHIDEANRNSAIENGLRVCKTSGVVIFFEPNEQTIKKIRLKFPDHPLAADPNNYINTTMPSKKIEGEMMDIYIFRK